MSIRDRVAAAGAAHPLAPVGLGVVLYAIGPVFVQASAVSGPAFSFWRLWLAVPVLALLAWLHVRGGGRWPSPRAWRWAGYAGLAFGAHQLLFFSAIKATTVIDVSLVTMLAPVVVAIAAVPLFGERPGLAFRAWTLVAIVGAAIVVLAASAGPEGDPFGMGMAVANVVVFATFFLLSKLGREEIDVLPFLLGVMTVAALSVSVFAVVTGEPVGAIGGRDLAFAGVVGLGPGILGHFVMTWPLRWIAANIPPVMRLGQPALSGLLAWWFLGEAIVAAHLVGGGLTLLGVGGALLTPAGRRFAAGRPPTSHEGQAERRSGGGGI